MSTEKITERNYVPVLRAWLASVRERFKLPDKWIAAFDQLDQRLVEQPMHVTAVEVGRLFQPLETHRMVTDRTPGADRVLQFLIEADRVGPIDKVPAELKAWFRKHYMWATGTTSMHVSELSTNVADDVIRRYFGAS